MADRSGAYLFSRIFRLLNEHVQDTQARRKIALEFWKESQSYDFSPDQMDCDDVLMKLGLARQGVDPDYPEEGEIVLYGPDAAPLR
jgi:hypothetical protein